MLNNFQRDMLKPENRHVAWEIVKLFNPDIPDTYITKKGIERKSIDKMDVRYLYDWITIKSNQYEIGVEFYISLWGPGWKLNHFEQQLKINTFRAWRFALDCKYDPDVPRESMPDVNPILKKYRIRKPTAQQMMDYYYKD